MGSVRLKVVEDNVKPVPALYVVFVSVAVIVTAPVAPDIDILEPATIEVTPALVSVKASVVLSTKNDILVFW